MFGLITFTAVAQLYRYRTGTCIIKVRQFHSFSLNTVKENTYELYRQTVLLLKGQSHEIFCSRFFPLTAPPGPIINVLGPFLFFLLFHRVIGILK